MAAAKDLVSRAVLCKGIYELWGRRRNHDELRLQLQTECSERSRLYEWSSFKFSIDAFQGSRNVQEQTRIVESFAYLDLKGPILMHGSSEEFVIFEEYEQKAPQPKTVALGRLVGHGARHAITTYTLKKRKYLSTTSMDSELALIGANLVLAAPGKIVYDPFVGTGSLPLACSHYGAIAYGSDLDGRAVRGKDGLNLKTNFEQYGLQHRDLGGFIGDLTHSPLRRMQGGWMNAIVCDPPYGVREGLKVLGSKDGKGKGAVLINGRAAHLYSFYPAVRTRLLQWLTPRRQEHYVPPKKPYSFERLLLDILHFSAEFLVDNGRLSFWMPTANDEDQALAIPSHPCLELKSNCVQTFNKCGCHLHGGRAPC